MFQGYFMGVSTMFQESFRAISLDDLIHCFSHFNRVVWGFKDVTLFPPGGAGNLSTFPIYTLTKDLWNETRLITMMSQPNYIQALLLCFLLILLLFILGLVTVNKRFIGTSWVYCCCWFYCCCVDFVVVVIDAVVIVVLLVVTDHIVSSCSQ